MTQAISDFPLVNINSLIFVLEYVYIIRQELTDQITTYPVYSYLIFKTILKEFIFLLIFLSFCNDFESNFASVLGILFGTCQFVFRLCLPNSTYYLLFKSLYSLEQ